MVSFRLSSEMLKHIPKTLREYDANLKCKTGATMVEIAKHAIMADPKVDKLLKNLKAAVIPCTAGFGVIEGFCDAVAAILDYIGLKAIVTKNTDIMGIGEAFARKVDIIFSADDNLFGAFNLVTKKFVDNPTSTGLAFASALQLAAGWIKNKRVLVIGVGHVGSAAVDFLIRKGANITAVDIDRKKLIRLRKVYGSKIKLYSSIKQVPDKINLIFLATHECEITEDMVDPDKTLIAAPATPLNLSEGVRRKLSNKKIIHDPLQLGVVTMVLRSVKSYHLNFTVV